MSDFNDAGEPLNLSYLEKISGANTKFIITTIDLFNSRIPNLMEEIAHAIALQDSDKLAFTVHKIKTSFSYLGREDIIKDLIEIEQLALSQEGVINIMFRFKHVKAEVDRLMGQLMNYKKELQE